MMSLNAVNDRGLADALQRRWFIRDDLSVSMMPELAATCDLETTPELRYPLGWKRWCAGGSVAAVAAQAARVQVRVPDKANVIVVVERFQMENVTSADSFTESLGFGPGNVDLANVLATYGWRDGRLGLTTHQTVGMTTVSTGTNAALDPFGFGACITAASGIMVDMPGAPWVLMPGNAFQFGSQTVNTQVLFNITFRERMLNDQEASL